MSAAPVKIPLAHDMAMNPPVDSRTMPRICALLGSRVQAKRKDQRSRQEATCFPEDFFLAPADDFDPAFFLPLVGLVALRLRAAVVVLPIPTKLMRGRIARQNSAYLFHTELCMAACEIGIVRPPSLPIFAPPFCGTMAKKGNRVQVILECTEHKESGMPGTSRYISTKNRKNTPERVELKKFNRVLRKMTIHKEIK
jgi:large subunit ribosomal protein L33